MKCTKEKWEEIKDYIRREHDLADIVFKSWLVPLEYNIDEKEFYIIIPDELGKSGLQYIEKRFKIPFVIAIEETCKEEYTIHFSLAGDKIIKRKNNKSENEGFIREDTNLSTKHIFETFVVGESNAFAQASSLAVAETPGEIYNPLYIYGGSGLGKTHLMHAIGNYIVKDNKDKKVLYVTAEDFTNEIINAIRNGNATTLSNFREKYRNVDVLLIDDIEFIAGKASTQEEFFYTFNELQSKGKQIVITSDKPPRDLDDIEERMRGRFSMGLTAEIGHPNYATRIAILKTKAEENNIELDDEIFDYIANHILVSVRELIGALQKLDAYNKLVNEQITLEKAEEILESMITPNNPTKITPQVILEVVASNFDVPLEKLTGKGRQKKITIARQVVMYLCKEMTDLTYKQIGGLLSDRDHSTITYGIGEIEKKYETDQELRNKIDTVRKILG